MKTLFLRTKSCDVLLLLKDSEQQWYSSKLAREAKCSIMHVTYFLPKLQAFGVITMEKKGKRQFVKLTEKGMAIAMAMEDLLKKCQPS